MRDERGVQRTATTNCVYISDGLKEQRAELIKSRQKPTCALYLLVGTRTHTQLGYKHRRVCGCLSVRGNYCAGFPHRVLRRGASEALFKADHIEMYKESLERAGPRCECDCVCGVHMRVVFVCVCARALVCCVYN